MDVLNVEGTVKELED